MRTQPCVSKMLGQVTSSAPCFPSPPVFVVRALTKNEKSGSQCLFKARKARCLCPALRSANPSSHKSGLSTAPPRHAIRQNDETTRRQPPVPGSREGRNSRASEAWYEYAGLSDAHGLGFAYQQGCKGPGVISTLRGGTPDLVFCDRPGRTSECFHTSFALGFSTCTARCCANKTLNRNFLRD